MTLAYTVTPSLDAPLPWDNLVCAISGERLPEQSARAYCSVALSKLRRQLNQSNPAALAEAVTR